MPAIYSNSRWPSRAVGVFPIVAVGLGLGAAIGGFAGFAVESALIGPPQDIADASRRGAAGTTVPVQPVQPVPLATPQANPAAATIFATASPEATTSQAPAIPTVQSPLTPWPDALTRSYPAAPAAAEATPPAPAPAAVTPNAQANDATRPSATAAAQPRAGSASDVKTTPAKRLARRAHPSNNVAAAKATRIQPVYDYYGNGYRYGDGYRYGNGADATSQSGRSTAPDVYRRYTGYSAGYNGKKYIGAVTTTRVYRQYQDSVNLGYGPRPAAPPPPQPPPLFGGLSGGGDRYDRWQ
jgi:hypothetical protein